MSDYPDEWASIALITYWEHVELSEVMRMNRAVDKLVPLVLRHYADRIVAEGYAWTNADNLLRRWAGEAEGDR